MKKSLILNLTLALMTHAAMAADPAAPAAPTARKPSAPAQKAGQTTATTTGSASRSQRVNDTKSSIPAAAVSTASARPSMAQNLSASFVSYVSGPTVGSPGDTSPFNTENSVGLGMKLANGASVGAAMNFNYTPVNSEGFELADPYLSIKKGLLDRNGYSLLGQVRAYAPVSTLAQAANQIGRTRLVLVQNYAPSNSRWSVGLMTYAQAYFYNGNRAANATRIKVLAEPTVNYQIKPNLSAGLTYDMLAKNKYDNSFFNFFEADETALMPGVSWDVNERLNLSPMLSIPTGKRIATDTTTLNVLLSMRLL